MRIPVSRWWRAAVALGLAASLALATPVAAQDDRFPAPGKDLLKVLCVIFGGIPFEYAEVGVYGCDFDSGDVTCDGKECWIVVVELAAPPLKDECDYAGGKYSERGAEAFSCGLEQGALMLDCVDSADSKQRQCFVGWDGKTPYRFVGTNDDSSMS